MENIDKVSEMAFHGVTYIIKMSSRDDVLNMEIEQKDTGSIWKNVFTSNYIEEITQKTGNFKKYGVFVKMLLSSITKASDSVFLDILTSQDLELMKARKQRPDARSSVNPNQVKNTKRYMILTYSVEYDKVHYPLPLNYEENPDVEVLKNTIRRLRMEMEELKNVKSATTGTGNDSAFLTAHGYGENDNKAENTALKLENEGLKEKIKKLEDGTASGTFKKLGAVENDNTLKAKMELEEELDNLKKDYVKHIKKMQTKLEETEALLEKAREDASKARSERLGESDKAGRRISKDEEYEYANLKKSVQKYQRDIENLNHELEALRNTDKKSKARIRQLETELESALKRATYSRGSNNSTFTRSREPSPNNSATKRFNSVPSKNNYSPGFRAADKKTPMSIRTPSNRGTPTRTTPTGTPTRNQYGGSNSNSKTYQFGQNRQKSPANARNTSQSINSQSSVGSYKKTTPTNRTTPVQRTTPTQRTTPQRTNQRDTFGLNKKSPVPTRNFSPSSSLNNNNKPKNYSPSPNRLSPGSNRFGLKYNNFMGNNSKTSINNKSKTSNFSDSEDELGGSNKNIRSMRQPMSNVTSKNNTYGVSNTRSNPNANSVSQQKLKENIQNFKESQNTVKAPENVDNNGLESSVEIADISDRLNKLQDLLRQAKS